MTKTRGKAIAKKKPVPKSKPVPAKTSAPARPTEMEVASEAIEQLSREARLFKPSKEFSAKAHVKNLAAYEKMYNESVRNPDKFWGGVAKELHWFKPFKKVLDWK